MPKPAVNVNGSSDSRLGVTALHFVSMPPEHFDWSDRQAPQPGPAQAGLAPAGLAEAAPLHAAPPVAAPAPPPAGAPGPGPGAMPDLVVRSRRSVHQFQAGTTYRIGRDPNSDIVMTDSRISWHHGVLRLDGNAWVLEDLGSTNGTFLGVQRLDRVDISNECIVRLGNPDDGPILRCTPQASAPPPPLRPRPRPPPASAPPRPPDATRARLQPLPLRSRRPLQLPPPLVFQMPASAAIPTPGGSRPRPASRCRLRRISRPVRPRRRPGTFGRPGPFPHLGPYPRVSPRSRVSRGPAGRLPGTPRAECPLVGRDRRETRRASGAVGRGCG